MIKASALKPIVEMAPSQIINPLPEAGRGLVEPVTGRGLMEPTTISSSNHFQNMKIKLVNEKPYPPAVERMAVRMLNIYKDIEEVLHTIYKAYDRGENKFTVSMRGKDSAQKRCILDWLEDMKAVIGDYHYESKTNSVVGSIEELPRSRTFLSGRFMEIAIAKKTEGIISRLAERYNQPFDVKSNVVVSTKDGIVQNEFDVVIMFAKILYVIEIKAGRRFRDYSKYYSVGRKYGIVPNRILLFDSSLEAWEADMAEYFAEYYVATIESFEDKLVRMISADMEVEKYA